MAIGSRLRDLDADPHPIRRGANLGSRIWGFSLELLRGLHIPAMIWSAATLLVACLHSPLLSLFPFPPPPPRLGLPLVVLPLPAARVMSGGVAKLHAPGSADIGNATGAVEGQGGRPREFRSFPRVTKTVSRLGGAAYCLISPSAGIGGAPVGCCFWASPISGGFPLRSRWISSAKIVPGLGVGIRGTVRFMLAPDGVSLFLLRALART